MDIIEESQQRSSSPLIIDNFGVRYKIITPISFNLTAPELILLEDNYYYLLKNSDVRDFESKYKWRPDYLAYDKYGTVVLDKLLMYVNSVQCIEDFDLDKIFIPTMSAISHVCSQMKLDVSLDDLEVLAW